MLHRSEETEGGGKVKTERQPRSAALAVAVVVVALALYAPAPGCAHAPGGGAMPPLEVATPPPPEVAATPPPAMHPHHLADLTPNGPFPRFTPEQLAASGYPDHMHAFFWPDWQPPLAADGLPYGVGSLCRRGQMVPRDGLTVDPGRLALPWLTFACSPDYAPCDLMLFVELSDWARHRAHDLLGLAPDGQLRIVNPDNLESYMARTGYGSWRLYRLDGDSCIVEPVPTLQARTLVGHVAVELTTLWTLDRSTGDRLPLWLRQGLASYLADMGPHLANFMSPYRPEGPVFLPPAEIDTILAAPPDPNGERDQKRFRCASYSAFVMVWRLVEDHGGLPRLREALAGVVAGDSWARVCSQVYGVSPAELSAQLDPVSGAEPIGAAVQPRSPHLPPAADGS